MSLKTATIILLICICVNSLIALTTWAINVFSSPTQDYRLLFDVVSLVRIFITSIPMILFFSVLYAKQCGMQNKGDMP